jgi:hypothetical protein
LANYASFYGLLAAAGIADTKVNFTGGEYDLTIDGQNFGSCETLTIVGTLNLQGATMAVMIENKYGVGTWPIIKYTNGRTGTFNNST